MNFNYESIIFYTLKFILCSTRISLFFLLNIKKLTNYVQIIFLSQCIIFNLNFELQIFNFCTYYKFMLVLIL